ncbi:MAG: DUF1385 domain-containing protein [Nanoarchaeota archaeon]|nr:DUF1385 domain-containing protein [Nanoarchaeota archaeon]MBU1030153.1 DUF1385 domain-containing protein [Nanoarchaeota archaeon]MBU1850429.1 DUF1385 domain-containing protein [Nanoarchaeota archaeon]
MKKILVGGQAVIEGVMMRSPNYVATAVRRYDGKIVVEKKNHLAWTKRNKILGWPFVRGIIVLAESLSLGLKSLSYSANQAVEEEETLSTKEIVFSMILAVIFALVIFKLLPLFIANVFKKRLGLGNFTFNLVDGFIKIGFFILYIWLISLMKDVRRMFEYHGAEHKAVHCYEHGTKLTIKNVKKYTTLHARCGTAFIIIVLLISILFYILIPFKTGFFIKYFLRILLLPLIAGVAYELIKISAKYEKKCFFKILLWPGLLMQKITTKEPDDLQLEVAIKSLEIVLKAEKQLNINS